VDVDQGRVAERAQGSPRRGVDFSRALAEKGWYHSFRLPDGREIEGHMSLGHQLERWSRFPIPADLRGKRLLDVGAWDGWFSFEAERRGAAVTAIDCVEIPNFRSIHRALSSGVDYRILDFFDLPTAELGRFDYVLFLGVLYHLKHPLLALEMVCGMTTETAIVESFVTDGDEWQRHREDVPSMEFYETDELGNQMDNWIGPTVGCLLALCRAAGFARVDLLHASGRHAGVACFRKWEDPPPTPGEGPPDIFDVINTRTGGINFSSHQPTHKLISDEYISCSFGCGSDDLTREQLRFEVGGYGVPALYLARREKGWLANFRIPPGLADGWHNVRLRTVNSGFSRMFRIAVGQAAEVKEIVVKGVKDGLTWEPDHVGIQDRGFITLWVGGLAENADRVNVQAYVSEERLEIDYVGAPDDDGFRQVNAIVPGTTDRGPQPLRVVCAGVSSDPWPIIVD